MITELWESFPRNLVSQINQLLEDAEPNANKAFQLYKTCQTEGLWEESFEAFSARLRDFYSLPRHQRRKSDFDSSLNRPMPHSTFESFHLNFRNAVVNNLKLQSLANWAHHLIRVGYKTQSIVISNQILERTLQTITNPSIYDKAEDIEFEDFCAAWKKTVHGIYGHRHDSDLNGILAELHRLNKQLKDSDEYLREKSFFPTIYLTQTEIDWTLAVRQAAIEDRQIPEFPLSRGPQKQRLIELEKTITLFQIVRTTKLPDLLKHRASIRATIIDRCDALIREKAA